MFYMPPLFFIYYDFLYISFVSAFFRQGIWAATKRVAYQLHLRVLTWSVSLLQNSE